MLFDSVMLASVASEIRQMRDNSIRDIWQSDGNGNGNGNEGGRAIYLQFRDATLLIDTHPQRARLHFVTKTPTSSTRSAPSPFASAPIAPSAFTQTLRKALRGARLVQIQQPNFDRVLRLSFQSRDSVGEDVSHTLVAELMERRSNVILLDSDDIIIDALKRLPPFLNRVRTILPHQAYELPPSNQENPLLVNDWRNRVLVAQKTSDWQWLTWLRENFSGVSPLVARALQMQLDEAEKARLLPRAVDSIADRSAEDFASVFEKFWQDAYGVARGAANVALCGNQPYPFALNDDCQARSQTLSSLIEECATREDDTQTLTNERAALLSHLAKREKINKAQRDDVEKAQLHAQDAERFLDTGNLMLTRIGEVENALGEGRKSLELTDENGAVFSADLEPDWNAADNAQRYFNRYRRALKLGGAAPERNRVLEIEQTELANWREQAQNAQTMDELEIIARDCDWQRGEKTKTVSRTKQQEESSRPESKLRQRDIEGWRVWMGRSALENQILLSKVARPSDIWMHVRDAPSAHVLIKNQKGKAPPIPVLEDAARWLANVSRKGKSGETLEIIYTPAKWVRAVKGSPGRVTLGRFDTLLITT